jgi:hypothetical protein
LPELGDLPLAEVRARHVVDLFHKLRTDRERNLAQRTIYNIYTVVAALFRDAKIADLIEQSPCILDERQLGPLVDKHPEWRNDAVFARDEVETIRRKIAWTTGAVRPDLCTHRARWWPACQRRPASIRKPGSDASSRRRGARRIRVASAGGGSGVCQKVDRGSCVAPVVEVEKSAEPLVRSTGAFPLAGRTACSAGVRSRLPTPWWLRSQW